MKNKLLKNRGTVLSFTFLFSGNIIHSLFYSGGNPLLCFLVISAVLVIFTKMFSTYFLSRQRIKSVNTSRVLAIAVGVLTVIPFSYTVLVYVKILGAFSAFYATMTAVVFAAISAVFLGVYSAYKGERSVYGFARMTFALSVVWILSGVFGLLFTKKLVPLYVSFKSFSDTHWLEIFKNTALITFDTIFLFVILSDNRVKSERKELCSGICRGIYLFISASGINLLKNLLIFGADFAKRLDSPDLAAIQLIPMFELPELGVIINTFAVTVRGSVYMCALMFMLKDSFAESYNNKKVLPVLFAAFGVTAATTFFFAKNISVVSMTAALCTVLLAGVVMLNFSSREKK